MLVRCTITESHMTKETSETGTIHAQSHDRVLHIRIDHTTKRNAITPHMLGRLARMLTLFEENADQWVALVTADGEHTTAGLDMPRFFGPDASWNGFQPDEVHPFGLGRRCTKPIVMVIQGITFTAGIEIMLGIADIVVAADTARLSQLEPKRGIVATGGAHFRFVQRSGWGNAMYHLLRADTFDAAEALRIGLVQEVVPHGEHVERGWAIAREIAAHAPLAVQAIKIAAQRYLQGAEAEAIGMLPWMQEQTRGTADAAEGLQSFIERRAAVFNGR